MTDGSSVPLPVGKVVCVGRNYAAHAAELGNPVPAEPLIFHKPATSLTPLVEPIELPTGKGDVHYEAEIAVLIARPLRAADASASRQAIGSLGLALDLTLRDLQSTLKAKGHPWERAKAFDGACPLSPFAPWTGQPELDDLSIRLWIGGSLRQEGHSSQMLTGIADLLAHMSQWFTLQPGDVVLTGTPAGVGQLRSGDELRLELSGPSGVLVQGRTVVGQLSPRRPSAR